MRLQQVTYTLFGFDSDHKLVMCTEFSVGDRQDLNQELSQYIKMPVTYVGYIDLPLKEVKHLSSLEKRLRYFTSCRSIAINISSAG